MEMKTKKLITLIRLILLSIIINANTISKTDALQKARAFLSSKDDQATIETYSILGKAEMYKVITDRGWCLMTFQVMKKCRKE